MGKRVIELIRVSTESQAGEDRAGIPAQHSANQRTATQYGLDIIRTIQLSDVSGAAVLRTPEMQELLQLMESPEIHGVVTKEFSRLMRPENFSDYALLQAFVDTKTMLYLPDGPIDLSSKSGRLMGTIRAAIAGLERTEILERSWLAKEEKRRAGKHPQSKITLPFGVEFDKERGWFYKPEAEKVKEAFRLFLSGDTNYFSVGRKVGIAPFNLRVIMQNPIYCGWRVYDKRRDPSGSARRTRTDGRQADRPKIRRAPQEVIRVRVIERPLVSEDDFAQVQQMMNLKKRRHWRSDPNDGESHHRWTYNGFLTCSRCGHLVYTSFRRRDYYVCSAKRTKGSGCQTRYMRREILEPKLDHLFSRQLTDVRFLRNLASCWEATTNVNEQQAKTARMRSELESLSQRRQRVLDSYFEGVISREERDQRLAVIERDQNFYRDLLLREMPPAGLTAEDMARAFAPFFEWEFLGRSDKRRLLSIVVPEIHVADYKLAGISVLTGPIRRNEVSHTAAALSPMPFSVTSSRAIGIRMSLPSPPASATCKRLIAFGGAEASGRSSG
jgi:DNA invertase Pin-like site-specific DNA recombinase